MKNRIVLCAILASTFLIAGCDSREKSPPVPSESGVRGTVLGRRMPGEERTGPPRPIKPLKGVIVRVTDESGAVVAKTNTDDEGRFQINLLPGKYCVAVKNPTDPGKEGSRQIEVQAGFFSEADIGPIPLYD